MRLLSLFFYLCHILITSRLWERNSSVCHWKGLFHRLRSDWSPVHYVGADRLCPEAPVPSGHCSHWPPAPIRHETPASHPGPLPSPDGSGDFGLLCGTSCRIQHPGGFLVISGWDLLLFHLALHHWTGGFCSCHTHVAEVQETLPDRYHGWVQIQRYPWIFPQYHTHEEPSHSHSGVEFPTVLLRNTWVTAAHQH